MSFLPKFALSLALIISVAGCAEYQRSLAPSDQELIENAYVPQAYRPPLAPRYCYRTLAKADCYEERQPEDAYRRQGSYHRSVDQ